MSSVQIFLLTIASMYASANEIATMKAFDTNVHVPERCWNLLKRETDNDSNFCVDKPNNYPIEHMDQYVNEMKRKGKIDFHIKPQYSPEDQRSYRPDPCDGEEHKNCCSSSKMTTPYFIRSESKLKLVLQTSFFTQQVNTTKCLNDGVPCFEDFYLKDSNKQLSTRCKTNMGSTKLYVFNPATNKIEIVPAVFPVSCSCHVNMLLNVL